MGLKRHKPEDIVTKLPQVEVLFGQGRPRIDATTQEQIGPLRAQLVNSTPDPCCHLHEWPLVPLRGGTAFVAHAAFIELCALAARNRNGGLGPEWPWGPVGNRENVAQRGRCRGRR